jgi:microcin C transport system ATP-binding protein
MMNKSLLKVENLSVAFGRGDAVNQVVSGISFTVAEKGKVAIVGESGSGKSVTALSVLGLHDRQQVQFPSGRIFYNDQDILTLAEEELRSFRGKEIAMIFQEPMNALNPVYSIGDQLIEPLVTHEGLDHHTARKRMIEYLDRTGIKDPHKRFDDFPHMLSGGQLQRVMIAMALACNPVLLIADEPTTALDVTIEAQIMALIEDLQQEFGMAVLLITHDLNIVRNFAEKVVVMQDGRIVEQGTGDEIFESPGHKYTQHLLGSQPTRLVDEDEDVDSTIILSASNIRCHFPIKEGFFKRRIGEIKAVDNIDILIHQGETIGVVGESGSGKSTLGKCLLRLQSCEGEIDFGGNDLKRTSNRQLRSLRRDFQIVFQDPYSSLSPRMTIEQILAEGLGVHFPLLNKEERLNRCKDIMGEVDLETDMLSRYPHEFSGGQRQRIAIARVMLLKPKLIILDEPTSALDISVQKQILQLLRELQKRYGISYLFISHDLRVIRAMAHRVLVMKDGVIVERGDTGKIFEMPEHNYTRQLLQAALQVA